MRPGHELVEIVADACELPHELRVRGRPPFSRNGAERSLPNEARRRAAADTCALSDDRELVGREAYHARYRPPRPCQPSLLHGAPPRAWTRVFSQPCPR